MKRALVAIAVLGLGRAAGAGSLADEVLVLELSRSYDAEALGKAAASADARDRHAAVLCAARLKDPRALPWLLPLLDDPVGPVRRGAMFALGQIGTAEVVLPLRERLDKLAAPDLPFALGALGKTKDVRATSDVARYLRHGDALVRGSAALALARSGDATAAQDVFAALSHEGVADVRWRLVYAMWILLRERARKVGHWVAAPVEWAEKLREAAAADRPLDERVFALRGLGQIDGQRPFLVERFDDADPRIVVEALRATAKPFDAATGKRAAALCGHADVLVQEAAIDHLAAGGKDAAVLLAEVVPGLADPRLLASADVALVAAGAPMATLPDTMADDLREETTWRIREYQPAGGWSSHARTPSPRTVRGQVAAAETCGKEGVPSEKAVPLLLDLLKAEDFAVRSTAVASLAARGAKEQADAIVATARAAQEGDVRIEAAQALDKLGVFDPWLVEAAGDPEPAVRTAACAALAKLGRPCPPAPPPSGFRLHGHDAKGVRAAADALRGSKLVLETTKGTIVIRLFPDDAPAHCVNVAALAGEGFYDGLTWHRVVADFVIQGGCPRGDGAGNGGVVLPDEIGERPYVRGTVGMPKGNDDTGGCQIFITHLPTPHLDGRYTVFGQVVEGFAVVDAIRIGDRILKARVALADE
ncbi:MAG TPA: peptidylprolyl isomerase [Planctomycetota bacterium]|nr:peptidylprolyl isomerase [Planctomycetota bacterium]